MVKQATQICMCGEIVNLSDGEVKITCSCGRTWEISTEGVLLTNLMFPFCQRECSRRENVPIVAKRERPRNKRKRRALKC